VEVAVTDTRFSGHDSTVSPESALAPLVACGPVSRPTLEPLALTTRAPTSEPEARVRAFRALYDAHTDFVWRNLRRLGVPESEIEDRTQEAFVVAHRRFDEFEDRGHGPRAWLFQIVLRVASDARRHRRRHPEDPDGGDATARASVDPTQGEALARREALWQLDAALETIDVGRRAVLVLHEIEEMTAPEIAQVLSIPLNTVYSRLRVARVELEGALARQGGER
jgi:RNA polymerase sigma-70 factor (ECF subfamily)